METIITIITGAIAILSVIANLLTKLKNNKLLADALVLTNENNKYKSDNAKLYLEVNSLSRQIEDVMVAKNVVVFEDEPQVIELPVTQVKKKRTYKAKKA